MDGSSTGVIHHEEPSLLTQVRNNNPAEICVGSVNAFK